MTGTALHSKPFSRQCISTKNTLMAVYTSVNKHSRCMIRLLYCILLFSLCSRASLLKASVGNMTHMALSVIPTSSCCVFMIRLIPKIQLSPPPPDELASCGGQAYFAKTNSYGLICQATGRHDLAKPK